MMDAPAGRQHERRSGRRLGLAAVAVAASGAGLLLVTSGPLPMAWDEGNAILRAGRVAQWVSVIAHPGGGGGEEGQRRPDLPEQPLSAEGIAWGWNYTTQLEGHPALYGMLIALGRWIGAAWLGPLDAARLGPTVLFALAAGAMFYRLGRQYSAAAGLGAVGALLLMPRMFAHAHFASFDGPLVSCWVLAWALFDPARQSRKWSLLWGLVLGMTLSAKATGWIAPLPFLVWAAVYRDRGAARTLLVGLPVALLSFIALNPPLWHGPIEGLGEFFALNFHRGEHGGPALNIPIQFFGEIYHLGKPLPWYNTLVWTATTVPVGILVLAMIGLRRTLCRWRGEPAGMLIVLHWVVLLIVRALPFAPPHDGVRLFLPAFAFLAALAGIGCGVVWHWARAKRRSRSRAGVTGTLVVGAIYLGSATSLVWYAPQWLSYYNLSIGGLPGATAAGMEPTYYWDALDVSVLDWIHENTPEDEKALFGPSPDGSARFSPGENLRLLEHWGVLRRGWRPDQAGQWRWYVIQRRPSAYCDVDRWLIENGHPAVQKTIRAGGWGPWRLDVPLIEVYPYDDYRRALAATADERG